MDTKILVCASRKQIPTATGVQFPQWSQAHERRVDCIRITAYHRPEPHGALILANRTSVSYLESNRRRLCGEYGVALSGLVNFDTRAVGEYKTKDGLDAGVEMKQLPVFPDTRWYLTQKTW